MTITDSVLRRLRERVQAAGAEGTGLAIRGGGSKDFYVGAQRGSLLETRELDGILSYEPSELVVTAGAGTPLQELEQILASKGQYLPFEPPHFARGGRATVGGMVASGLAGPARANSGGVRDYVLGVEMVNGLGQSLRFGGQVIKNVAGYDVSRLMVGALGTLGVLTEVSLKVLPLPVAQASLQFALEQAPALEWLHRWGGQPLPLHASCWQLDAQAGPQLTLRLSGARAAVEAASRVLCAQAAGTVLAPDAAQALWNGLRHHTLDFFCSPASPEAQLWRLSVPATAPVLDLPGPVLVEWHGALRWVWAAPQHASALQAAARSVGGSAALFVLAPQGQSAAFRLQGDHPSQVALMRRLKASFDPKGLFNPSLAPDANPPRP